MESRARASAVSIACRAGIACRTGIVCMFGAAFLVGDHPALADHQPVIAMPGNWQVPVTVDGFPAGGAVITGDWGLYAPGRVTPEIIGPAFEPISYERGYYPRTGKRPRYGRQEVFLPRRLPPPAPELLSRLVRRIQARTGHRISAVRPAAHHHGAAGCAASALSRFARPSGGEGGVSGICSPVSASSSRRLL